MLDPSTGRSRVIAHVSYKGGTVGWLSGAGRFLVWVDQSATPNSGGDPVRWTMRAADVLSGATWTLGSSGPKATIDFPLPQVNDGHVAWTYPQPGHQDRAQLTVVDLATRRAVTRVLPAASDAVAYAHGDAIVFVPGHGGLDVIAYPVPTGTARVLAADGRASTFITTSGSLVAWTEIDPSAPDQDPRRIVVADLATAAPPRTVVAGINQGNPVLGADFLAYYTVEEPVAVVPLAGGEPVKTDDGAVSVASRLSASGDELVWAEYPNPDNPVGPVIIHLAHVSIS
jgi:hypothetical protein